MAASKLRVQIRRLAQKAERIKISANEFYGRQTASQRSLPHFIIGGAMKAGTTSLYDLLIRHPRVAGGTKKEIHFFDHQYEKGLMFYRSHFPKISKLINEEGYTILTGEATPSYLLSADYSARLISESVPEVKLIFLLRNPIDRAFSHYHHDKRRGRLKDISFTEIVNKEMVNPVNYLKRGHYKEQLENYLDYFPKEQIHIIISEEFSEDPRQVFEEVLRFLELENISNIQYTKSHEGDYSSQMDPGLKEDLRSYFDQKNKGLEELIGKDTLW